MELKDLDIRIINFNDLFEDPRLEFRISKTDKEPILIGLINEHDEAILRRAITKYLRNKILC